MKNFTDKFNSKALALTITIIWGMSVATYFTLMAFGIDVIAGLISVSGVESIVATNYYVKAKKENELKIGNDIKNSAESYNDGGHDINDLPNI